MKPEDVEHAATQDMESAKQVEQTTVTIRRRRKAQVLEVNDGVLGDAWRYQ